MSRRASAARVRGEGARVWVPRTPFLVLLGFEACISCFTRAREYQIAPNLARVCGLDLRGGERVVLVEQTAEPVAAPDLVRQRRLRRWRFGERWALLERAVRPV